MVSLTGKVFNSRVSGALFLAIPQTQGRIIKSIPFYNWRNRKLSV